jgi:hypothetical protein
MGVEFSAWAARRAHVFGVYQKFDLFLQHLAEKVIVVTFNMNEIVS